MLVPTSEDLEQRLHQILEGVEQEEKDQWMEHPCSIALATFFEAIRMKTFESFELGVDSDTASALAGQARLCLDLNKFVAAIRKPEVEEDVEA
jgi:hypothetical protein